MTKTPKVEQSGNAAAREALEKISHWIWSTIDPTCNDDCCRPFRELAKIADAALAAPARNCDVGDVLEQSKRFDKFCKETYDETDGQHICASCQFFDSPGECAFEWAQLPFAQKAAEGGKEPNHE